MDLFKLLVNEDRLHHRFNEFLSPNFIKERELLQEWWLDFLVKDGKKKTVKEFQTTFYSVFWEIYLDKVFKEIGYEIDENYSSPDFVLSRDSKNICVEAVVANLTVNGRGEDERTLSESLGENDIFHIMNESIIRLFNAICNKNETYDKTYKNLEVVKENKFVIALADYSQANYDQTYIYSMMALLYSAYYDPGEKEDLLIHCSDSIGREYKFKDKVYKDNGAPLNIGLFQNDKNDHISAIIYTCTLSLDKLTSLTINHPEKKFIMLDRDMPRFDSLEDSTFSIHRKSGAMPDELLADGIFVFHNPYAKKPLDEEDFQWKGVTHVRFDEDEYELIIDYVSYWYPLKRRRVGKPGQDFEHIKEMPELKFFPVPKAYPDTN